MHIFVSTPNIPGHVFVENGMLYYESAILNVMIRHVVFHILNVYVDTLEPAHVSLKAHIDNGKC